MERQGEVRKNVEGKNVDRAEGGRRGGYGEGLTKGEADTGFKGAGEWQGKRGGSNGGTLPR